MRNTRILARHVLGVLGVLAAASVLAQNYGYPPAGSIEAKYYAWGPYPVAATAQLYHDCASYTDTSTKKPTTTTFNCSVYGPDMSQYTGAPSPRPLIVWANGSGAQSSDYTYYLKHLASWGFYIIAVEDGNTGNHRGLTVLQAFDYMLSLNTSQESPDPQNPSNPYYGMIDTNDIGAAGHSQGAMGAIAALEWSQYTPAQGGMRRADGIVIKTAFVAELPNNDPDCTQNFSETPLNCTTDLVPPGTSILLIDGAGDGISTPADVSPFMGSEDSIAGHYDAAGSANGSVPADVIKVKATALGPVINGRSYNPGHNDIQGQPGCNGKSGCVDGVYGFLGYPTAWFMWQLQGAADAHSVFVAPSGELFTNTKWWEDTASNAQ